METISQGVQLLIPTASGRNESKQSNQHRKGNHPNNYIAGFPKSAGQQTFLQFEPPQCRLPVSSLSTSWGVCICDAQTAKVRRRLFLGMISAPPPPPPVEWWPRVMSVVCNCGDDLWRSASPAPAVQRPGNPGAGWVGCPAGLSVLPKAAFDRELSTGFSICFLARPRLRQGLPWNTRRIPAPGQPGCKGTRQGPAAQPTQPNCQTTWHVVVGNV